MKFNIRLDVSSFTRPLHTYGVESICKQLIAPSGYWHYAARCKQPSLRCGRAKHDMRLKIEMQRVYATHLSVYDVVKVWKQLHREGIVVARCTVERLMKQLNIQGIRRGKRMRTTISDSKITCPSDKVHRQFTATRPNQLWVSDFTYVSTWQGWLYVAFVIDVFARRIVGWRVSRSMTTDFVLDALEQALYARSRKHEQGLIHHSDCGVQCVRFVIQKGWQKRKYSHLLAVVAIAMTTR